MIISLDTETTGVDFASGAKPYLVTTCNDKNQQVTWEWYVDPKTREPIIEDGDIDQIVGLLEAADEIVMQNSKFDVHALQSIIPDLIWPWHKTHDTLIAAHVLASNSEKNLTALGVNYLGINTQPYEDAMEKACHEVTRLVRKNHPSWMIARKGLACMPSAKEKTWKYDTWLPRAYAKQYNYLPSHPYYTVTTRYANSDSDLTMKLWPIMRAEIERRGLWNHYLFRMKDMRIAQEMERHGVTFSRRRVQQIRPKYVEKSLTYARECVSVAERLGHNLILPKKGINDNLRSLYNDIMRLEPRYSKKTGKQTFDKDAMDYYLNTLEGNTPEHDFLKAKSKKDKLDTSLSYLNEYTKYANLRDDDETYSLRPNLNPTGSSTLRWSHNNPNSANVSNNKDDEGHSLRYCFGPAEGREWWSLDAKNIELRIPFYTSGEQAMIDLFERSNEPPYYGSNHILIFSLLWEEQWQRAIKEHGLTGAAEYCKTTYKDTYYRYTKNGDFAIQYGSGEENADKTYHQKGAYRKINQRFTKLNTLNQKWIAFANKHGYVETLPDRTVDPTKGYPLLCTRTEYGKILTTVPLSYHVQGSAMWLTSSGMKKVDAQLEEWRRHDNYDGFITLQVHDEIVLDVPRRADPRTNPRQSNLGRMRVIQRTLEGCGQDFVPSLPTPFGLSYHPEHWAKDIAF